MSQRETLTEEVAKEIQEFVLMFEAMRAAAHARKREVR